MKISFLFLICLILSSCSNNDRATVFDYVSIQAVSNNSLKYSEGARKESLDAKRYKNLIDLERKKLEKRRRGVKMSLSRTNQLASSYRIKGTESFK